jgi:hypothetical protein
VYRAADVGPLDYAARRDSDSPRLKVVIVDLYGVVGLVWSRFVNRLNRSSSLRERSENGRKDEND